MERTEEKYLKYLLTNLEKDFISHYGGDKNLIFIKVLERLKNSADLLRDIYILAKIKKLEIFSAYLLFILKKAAEKQISFDNLLENIEQDREFLKTELLQCLGEDSSVETWEEDDEKIKEKYSGAKEQETEWHTPAALNETLETEFLETETITETTDKETEPTEIYAGKFPEEKEEIQESEEDRTLELINREGKAAKEEIYNIPESTGKQKPEDKETPEFKETAEDGIFNIPEEIKPEEQVMTVTTEQPANLSENGKESKKSKKSKLKDLFNFKKQKKSSVPEETIQPDDNISVKKPEPPLTAEEEKQIKKILIEPAKEDYTDYNKSLYEEEQPEPEDITEEDTAENEIFNEYEKILHERNLIIAESLNLIKELNEEKKTAETETKEKELLEKIIENCGYMENYSREMTFEVITNIYSTIKLSLIKVKNTNYQYDSELIELFINAVILIRKLVSGDDYTGYENTVANIEEKQRILIAETEKKEREEKLKKEKEEVEKKLEEKYSDSKERKKLLSLKNKILSVENIFKSLDTIKGEFQTYEAHRLLSKTFPDFKHIVNLSRELEIEHMAELSEASYIFIKYVQNYRVDPFGNDVKEILNYITVNFKLLFLGKTSKDVEIFITYLNTPDKIFTEKKS